MGSDPGDFRARRWPPVSTRQRRRRVSAFVLLFLAGTFSLRGWRAATMIDPSSQFRNGEWSTDVPLVGDAGADDHCEWKYNGPLLYTLQHSNLHADGKGHSSVPPSLFMRFE